MLKIFITFFIFTITLFAQHTTITVGTQAQKFIVEKIAKTKIRVESVYPDSNFNIKLKKSRLKSFAHSTLFMTMNLDIEKKILRDLKNINNNLEIFDMSKDVKKITEDGIDNPYIWLDPLKTREVAKTVFFKLSKLDPHNREFYRDNYELFAQELDDLYIKIKFLFATSAFSIYAFENSWDYYFSRFDLPTYKIEKKVLEATEVSSFINLSKQRNAQVLFVDDNTSSKLSKSISNNLIIKVINSNIYNYSFLGDLLLLSQNLARK